MIGRPLTPVSFAGARRRGRRRGLVVGAAVGAGMARRNAGPTESPVETSPAAVPAEDDAVAQLQQLAQLKDQGILTDEEFAAKKAQILGL